MKSPKKAVKSLKKALVLKKLQNFLCDQLTICVVSVEMCVSVCVCVGSFRNLTNLLTFIRQMG